MAAQLLKEAAASNKSERPLRILIHTFYATGHVLPMQAVSRKLVSQGHEVVWLTSLSQESRVLASGARFVATDQVARADAALQAATPLDLDGAIEALFGDRLLAQVADIRTVLRRFRPDCLLNDALPQGAEAVYDLGEVPFYATLGVVPMYLAENMSTHVGSSDHHLPKSALGTIMSTPELLLPCINSQRALLGLLPVKVPETLQYSPLLHIQASCPMLEFRENSSPIKAIPNLQYVGPLVSQSSDEWIHPPWWEAVERASCVIGITQGTFAVDPSLLIIPAIKALCQDKTLLLVVPSSRVEEIWQQVEETDNIRIADWIPYDLLLPQCNILITNGGYGSVTQALSHGIPLICAGTTEDKKDTAERVTWVGAGIDLATESPTPEQIRDAVDEILNQPQFKDRAMQVAGQLNSLGGAEKACIVLENAIRRSLIK